jgi:hypothetical protein
VFDLDNDGALEVLYADQGTFYIFDGSTGEVRFSTDDHHSGTAFEFPVVADLGNDGHAEILVVNNYGGADTLIVYEHDGDGWPAAGPTWPSYDYSMSNVDPDGRIPKEPDPGWLTYGVYRGRLATEDPVAPDLVVSITDVCVADCDYGPVSVGVMVGNVGTREADAGAILSLYSVDSGLRHLVATTTLPEVPRGSTIDAMQIDLSAADVGNQGWVAVVDPADAVRECDESNNEDTWADSACP